MNNERQFVCRKMTNKRIMDGLTVRRRGREIVSYIGSARRHYVGENCIVRLLILIIRLPARISNDTRSLCMGVNDGRDPLFHSVFLQLDPAQRVAIAFSFPYLIFIAPCFQLLVIFILFSVLCVNELRLDRGIALPMLKVGIL